MSARTGEGGLSDLWQRGREALTELLNARDEGRNVEDIVGDVDLSQFRTVNQQDQQQQQQQQPVQEEVDQVSVWQDSQKEKKEEEPQHKIAQTDSLNEDADSPAMRRARQLVEARKNREEEERKKAQEQVDAVNSWSGLDLGRLAMRMGYDQQNADRENLLGRMLPMTNEEAEQRQLQESYDQASPERQAEMRRTKTDPNSLKNAKISEEYERSIEEDATHERNAEAQRRSNKEMRNRVFQEIRDTMSRFNIDEETIENTITTASRAQSKEDAKSIVKGIHNASGKALRADEKSELRRHIARAIEAGKPVESKATLGSRIRMQTPNVNGKPGRVITLDTQSIFNEITALIKEYYSGIDNVSLNVILKEIRDILIKGNLNQGIVERIADSIINISMGNITNNSRDALVKRIRDIIYGAQIQQQTEQQEPIEIGSKSDKSYLIPDWLLKKKKMSDDKKIRKAVRSSSNSILDGIFKNRKKPDEDLTQMDRSERIQTEAMKKQLQHIDDCYVPTEGQYVDKEGNIRQSEWVEQEIDLYMKHTGLESREKWLVHHQVAKRLGYSCDRDGKYLLQDDNKIPDELFVQALHDLEEGYRLGNPYHLFAHNANTKLGGTLCYPIGVITQEEAEILCRTGGPLEGVDPYALITKARNEFVNITMPRIRRDAHSREGAGIAQLMVIQDYVRALCSLNDLSPRLFNVAHAADRGFEELMAQCDPALNPDADAEVLAKREEILKREEGRRNARSYRLDRRRNKVSTIYKEDIIDATTGEVIHKRGDRVNPKTYVGGNVVNELRSSKIHPFQAFCTFTCNFAKFMGIIGFAPVIVGGYVEHLSGNIFTKESNYMLKKIYGGGDAFDVNEGLKRAAQTDEFVEGIKAWKLLLRVGGQDAVALFYDGEGYGQLTMENARRFLDDCVNKQSLFTGEKAKKVKRIAATVSEGIEFLVPGDIGFNRKDALRFMEGFMLNQRIAARMKDSGGVNAERAERAFTTSEVMEMIDAMGPAGFLAAATKTQAGRDSAVMMRYSTLARESPIAHAADSIMRRSGLTNLIVTMGIDTYFTYGLNMVQAMLPMFSTMSYLAVRFGNRILTGGMDNLDQENLAILEYQMGGLDSFGLGLVKNLIYDFTRIGNIGIFGCVIAAVFLAIGFDEPKDPGLKYRFDEYRIGRNIALGGFNEKGEPQGIPIYRAWWLDDLTLFGLPLAYGICGASLDQKLGDKDPMLGVKMFTDGCYDVLSGASIFDLVRSVKNAEQVVMEYDKMMTDPNHRLSTDWVSYAYMNFFELPLARAANKLLVPNAVRDMLRDEYEHSAYEVYKRDSTIPGATEPVKDWSELQRRIESRYNPVYAIFNNRIYNGYWTDDGTSQKTGYLYNEMPLATEPDARRTSFLEIKLGYTPLNEIPEDERADRIEGMCDTLFNMIRDEYNFDVDTARADGFTIPMDLRFEFAKYCERRQNYVNNVFNRAVYVYGVRGEEREEMYQQKEELYGQYKSVLNDFIWNTAVIPWSDKGYVKLRTDYETVYYRKSSNKPVSESEYILEGPGDIEKRYIPKGNHPNNFALFTTPETQNRGFNFETIAAWYDEDKSNLQKIFDEQAGIDPNKPINEQPGKFAKYGYNKNVPLNSAMFGGNLSFPGNTPTESSEYFAMNQPTAGRRALVPYEESMLWDLPNFNGKVVKDDDGNEKTVNANIPENSTKSQLKQITRENVDPGNLGELGKYFDADYWKNLGNKNSYGYSSRGGGGSSYRKSSYSAKEYNPKIYSFHAQNTHISNSRISGTRTNPNSRNVIADKAATMYAKQPQGAKVNTYLRPSFETKGSREAYKRQDI